VVEKRQFMIIDTLEENINSSSNLDDRPVKLYSHSPPQDILPRMCVFPLDVSLGLY
jgi:hypothetical protein